MLERIKEKRMRIGGFFRGCDGEFVLFGFVYLGLKGLVGR